MLYYLLFLIVINTPVNLGDQILRYIITEQKPVKKEALTSKQMLRVLNEIEKLGSGVPKIGKFSSAKNGTLAANSYVAPVIVFKESVVIFDFKESSIILVKNMNKNQDLPEIRRAPVLFIAKNGARVYGDISERDSDRLMQGILVKFESLFSQQSELPGTASTVTT